ncbi:unnamed protein product [Euphydryas editha]|uniref:Reverse transcriptase domain-containing protein n=1 Tax=Euphydryas editha TaxID=104508 RepID=A0AAU9V4I4_EUPED|nr:unnamed protein product [Euphydryas editha]
MSGIEFVSWNDSLVPTNVRSFDETLLIDEMHILNFKQFNTIRNRFDRILDLVFSTDVVIVSECCDPLVPVDAYHPALFINTNFIELTPLKQPSCDRYLYDRGDYDSINEHISSIDWEGVFASKSTDEATAYFCNKLLELQRNFIPVKKRSTNYFYPPWYNPPLIKLIKEKSKNFRKFKRYGRLSDELTFRVLRDRVSNLEKTCYNNYILSTESFIENDPKHFWSYIKKRSTSHTIPSSLKYGNITVNSEETICNAFSSFFYSSFNHDKTNNRYSYTPNPNVVSDISKIELNINTIENHLLSLDPSKSAGPDLISPKLLTKCAKTIAIPISLLFKKSLASCVVPQIWKAAYITPVHKKGSKTDILNYRPISKLCVLAKVFERIVYSQVYAALRNSFNPTQHGFLQGRSTVTNLILLNDFLTESMNMGKQVDVVYTDYSKAFDRINHNILLDKLFNAGIRGDLLRWFSSYISNRSQAVVLNNYSSSWVSIPSGVPQGSLLGPLLFTIYINDIVSCFQSSHLLCFADDMKVFATIESRADMDLLQADLSRLNDYCEINMLDLNPQKCSVVTFSRKFSNLFTSYKINDQLISRCSVVRDLGIFHDSKLIFDEHVDNIVAKASKALGFIMRCSTGFTKAKTLKILYCTFVQSHLEYASQIWNPCYRRYIDRIENVQKRSIKYLCYKLKLPYHSGNYLNMCKKLHILPLANRRRIADVTFLTKIMRNEVNCSDLLNKLKFNVPTKSIRYNPPLYIPSASSNYRQNSYLVRSIKDFNDVCKEYSFDPYCVSVSQVRKQLSDSFFIC